MQTRQDYSNSLSLAKSIGAQSEPHKSVSNKRITQLTFKKQQLNVLIKAAAI